MVKIYYDFDIDIEEFPNITETDCYLGMVSKDYSHQCDNGFIDILVFDIFHVTKMSTTSVDGCDHLIIHSDYSKEIKALYDIDGGLLFDTEEQEFTLKSSYAFLCYERMFLANNQEELENFADNYFNLVNLTINH